MQMGDRRGRKLALMTQTGRGPGRKSRSAAWSLALGARRLDDRPPLLNFGFMIAGKRSGVGWSRRKIS